MIGFRGETELPDISFSQVRRDTGPPFEAGFVFLGYSPSAGLRSRIISCAQRRKRPKIGYKRLAA